MKIAYITSLLILACSCTSNQSDNTKTILFNRNDFPETIHLSSPDTIDIADALDPQEFYLVKDSLVIISNRSAAQEYKAGLYLLNGKLIKEIAPKGNGPKEFISCTLDIRDSNSDTFYIEDVIQNKYWECSIDSIIHSKDYLLNYFTYSRDVIRLCPLENEYIGFNFWYLNNNKYDNGVKALSKYERQNDARGRIGSGHSYFVANITGGYVFTNTTKEQFWVANFFEDKISIYNDSLELIKHIDGPDHFNHQFKEIEEEDYKYIFFEKGTSYRGYVAYTTTPNYVYLVYEGTNGTPYRTNNLKNVEVFKLDWEGNLISNYQLDKHIYTISIDSQDKYLYATSCNSYEGDIKFIRYKLK
ncbi:BF3164 family lipoprotein [Phocaeicola sp.]